MDTASDDYWFTGSELRAAREAAGLSLRELGHLVDIGKSTLCKFEAAGVSPVDARMPYRKTIVDQLALHGQRLGGVREQDRGEAAA